MRHGLLFSRDDLNVKIFADGSEVIMTTARRNYNAHVKIMGTETVEHWSEQKESVALHRVATRTIRKLRGDLRAFHSSLSASGYHFRPPQSQ